MIGRTTRAGRGSASARAAPAMIALGMARLGRRHALDLPRRLDGPHELQDRAGRLRADAPPRAVASAATARSATRPPGRCRCATAFTNSLVVVLVSTAIVMLLALPAAYALAIRPVPKWRDVLFFFISTKFLPIVASIFPIYVYAEKWNLIGTRTILIVLYIAINLPLAIWMTRSFFMEVPRELIEAAEIDGTIALQPASLGDPADRRARHRGDRAPLRDLRLERVLLRHPAELRRRARRCRSG